MTRERAVFATLAALLLIAFFSSWVTLDLVFTRRSVSGAALPGQLRAFVDAAESVSVAFTGQRSTASAWTLLAYLLYAVPVAALTVLVRSVTGQAVRATAAVGGTVTLLLSALTLLIVTRTLGSEGVGLLAGGYWSTLLLSAALIAAAALLPRIRQPVLTSEQRAELGDRTRQVAAHTGAWLADRQAQVAQSTERRRIEHALGRTLDRSLIAADDTVVAQAGELVTHDLVQRARQAGVLTALLSSVAPQMTVAPER
ncbi:hypothetical protein [Deinococcus aquaticus]|uniref:hypothetical protein n=1 Tax=Deinococcus aquaticus TaxID=328692 RepID=UPI003F455B8C